MPITVDLGPELEAIVGDLIQEGRYASESELLGEGVRLVQARQARLMALEAALAEGLADIEAGRTCLVEETLARLEDDLALLSNPSAGLAEE